MNENTLIDILEFNPSLSMDHKGIFGMFGSYHQKDCCEYHYIDFDNIENDIETAKNFIEKVDKIEIRGVEGMGINFRLYDGDKEFCIFCPGRNSNNGYYSTNLTLTYQNGIEERSYDIEKFQEP